MVTRLRELREARFLTQLQLAETAQVSPATIVRIEQGQVAPNFQTIKKLAAALGIAPGELVTDAAALSAARRRPRRTTAPIEDAEAQGKAVMVE